VLIFDVANARLFIFMLKHIRKPVEWLNKNNAKT